MENTSKRATVCAPCNAIKMAPPVAASVSVRGGARLELGVFLIAPHFTDWMWFSVELKSSLFWTSCYTDPISVLELQAGGHALPAVTGVVATPSQHSQGFWDSS